MATHYSGWDVFTSIVGQTGEWVEKKELLLGEQVIKYGKAILLRWLNIKTIRQYFVTSIAEYGPYNIFRFCQSSLDLMISWTSTPDGILWTQQIELVYVYGGCLPSHWHWQQSRCFISDEEIVVQIYCLVFLSILAFLSSPLLQSSWQFSFPVFCNHKSSVQFSFFSCS